MSHVTTEQMKARTKQFALRNILPRTLRQRFCLEAGNRD